MYKYLISCLCSVLSYDFARSLSLFFAISSIDILANNRLNVNVQQMFWHVDVMILLFILPTSRYFKKQKNINILCTKFLIKDKILILFLSIPILATVLKSYAIKTLPGSDILPYQMLSYAVAIIISLVLHAKYKSNEWIALVLMLIGFVIVKSKNFDHQFACLLMCYSLLNGISILTKRYASRTRPALQGVVIENMLYGFIGVFNLLKSGGFNISVLFSWQVLLITLLCIGHHIFDILGNRASHSAVEIIICECLKIIFILCSGYFFFRSVLGIKEYIGIFIMLIGLVIYKSFKVYAKKN